MKTIHCNIDHQYLIILYQNLATALILRMHVCLVFDPRGIEVIGWQLANFPLGIWSPAKHYCNSCERIRGLMSFQSWSLSSNLRTFNAQPCTFLSIEIELLGWIEFPWIYSIYVWCVLANSGASQAFWMGSWSWWSDRDGDGSGDCVYHYLLSANRDTWCFYCDYDLLTYIVFCLLIDFDSLKCYYLMGHWENL